MTGKEILKRAFCISLFRRRDRAEGFAKRYFEATGNYARFVRGYDGTRLPVPEGWKSTPGAFGCALAHVAAWARAISDSDATDDDPLTFFEDDAVFCDDFLAKLDRVAAIVPDDWDLLYLGGEHLSGRELPPKVADGLVKGVNVNRLHAYVVRARAFKKIFPRLVKYLADAPRRSGPTGDETPHDYEFGRMVESGELVAYAARPFLVGQGPFGSDTFPTSRADSLRYWN
ncbi:MAG: hypothetical protein IJM30_05020 [Thermoguttaceae bacterium]|nr:hypothetical protein [Thermoguttaceae bacterium]